jgi:hypothetical protein
METCKDCPMVEIIERLQFNLQKSENDVANALMCSIENKIYIPSGKDIDTSRFASADLVDELDRQCGHLDSELNDKAECSDIAALVGRLETIETKLGIEG